MADVVNHPKHYNQYPVEVIEFTEWMNFNRGNAVKYIARAGVKSKRTEVEDLEKAKWYIEREIQRVKFVNQATEDLKARKVENNGTR